MQTKWIVQMWVFAAIAAATTAGMSQSNGPGGVSLRANRLVQIQAHFQVPPGSEHVLTGLINTDAVVGQAVREAAGVAVEEGIELSFDTVLERVNPEDPILVRIEFESPDAAEVKIPADKFLDAVCRRLTVVLDQVNRARTDQIKERIESTTRDLERIRTTVQESETRRREYSDKTGEEDLSRESVMNRLSELQEQRRELEMDVAAKRAYSQALEVRVAELGKQMAQTSGNEILQELQKVVDLRAQQLNQFESMRASGSGSTEDVREAQEKLAAAKADLARQRRDAAELGGGEQIRGFTMKLAETNANLAEMAARLGMVSDELKRIRERKLLDLATDLELRYGVGRNELHDALISTTDRLANLQIELSGIRRSSVTVITGDDNPRGTTGGKP